jgi:hypothetical protein
MIKQLLNVVSVTACSFLISFNLNAQTVYDANNGDITFLAANRTNQVGNGQSAGDVVLYTDVITIGSDEIDCIVRTLSINNASFSLPFSAASGTNAFDYSSSSGGGMSANEDAFFSPTLNFNSGGGYVAFRFEFIEDGSYSNGSGTPVILENVSINTYDIDGNGGSGSNQFNRFEKFSIAKYLSGTGSNIGVSFDASSDLTEFRSGSSSNTQTVTAAANRIEINYDRISNFEIQVGAEASGAAYFFLDFSPGPSWSPNTTLTPPSLDLNGSTTGTDNSNQHGCQQSGKFISSPSSTTITSSTSNLDEMEVSFNTADILDGTDEKLVINGATSGGSISLNFSNGANISNVSFKSNTFAVEAIVESGLSSLRFSNSSGGTFSSSLWEEMLDSFSYLNDASPCTNGDRTFNVRIRTSTVWSPPVTYTGTVNSALPVTLISFNASCEKPHTLLEWVTSSELNNNYFSVQKSLDGATWFEIGEVKGAGNSQQLLTYEFIDWEGNQDAYYRLKQVDFDGASEYSSVVTTTCSMGIEEDLKVYPIPSEGNMTIELPYLFEARLFNLQGQELWSKNGADILNIKNMSSGSYILNITYEGREKNIKVIVH